MIKIVANIKMECQIEGQYEKILSKTKLDGLHKDLIEDKILKIIYFTLTQ